MNAAMCELSHISYAIGQLDYMTYLHSEFKMQQVAASNLKVSDWKSLSSLRLHTQLLLLFIYDD
jgi:hypothetical protein